MEELRQQLGEALPTALGATALGMGRTTAELTKLIESGSVSFPSLRGRSSVAMKISMPVAGRWRTARSNRLRGWPMRSLGSKTRLPAVGVSRIPCRRHQ